MNFSLIQFKIQIKSLTDYDLGIARILQFLCSSDEYEVFVIFEIMKKNIENFVSYF